MATIDNSQMNSSLKSSYVFERTFSQIFNTIYFEVLRQWRKTLLLLGVYALVFAFFYVLNIQVYSDPNNPLPSSPDAYIQTYLVLITIMVLVIAAAYGSSIIVEDFEKQTGNLIFPNSTKFRLLTGRFIAAFILGTLSLVLFYILIAFDVFLRYGQIPLELWASLGWAILYLYLLLALLTFFSSFMPNTALVMILAFVIVVVVSVIARRLVLFTGYTGEPFFVISYFGDIISASLNMPSPRYTLQSFGRNGRIYTDWLTPAPINAFFGMLALGSVLFILAYIIFERRQN